MQAPKNSKLIVRHFYVDEAGIGHPEREPYTVVAGIVLHVDGQYDMLQKYLLDMADDLVAPAADRPQEFCFQAKQLWHGGGFFPRDKFPLPKRLEILGYLADIPKKFQLPIVYSCIERGKYAPVNLERKERATVDKKCHVTCFAACLNLCDRIMARDCPSEKIFAVVEQHDSHKEGLHIVAEVLSDPRMMEALNRDKSVKWRPLQHFVETPLFSKKSGSSPLQIADICAFILARALAAGNHIEPFLERIKPQLVTGFVSNFFEKNASLREVDFLEDTRITSGTNKEIS